MNNTFYENYKKLKEKLDYSYKGYNLKFLVAGYFSFVFDGVEPTLRDAVKSLYNSRKSFDLRKVTQAHSSVVISVLINRHDYIKLAEATATYCENPQVIDISSLPVVKFSVFSFHFWIFFCKAVRIVLGRSVGGTYKFKLLLIGVLLKLFNQIRLVEKSEVSANIEKYICFNSSYKEESLLTQFFNKRNIETITLQHGIFCEYKQIIPFDLINFENLQAQKILAWGESTIDYFSKNGQDCSKIILFGNPKYKNIRIDKTYQSFKSCLVLLGRGLYVETNNKLLEMLTRYNEKNNNKIIFYIKKHPFLTDQEHKQYAKVSHNMIFLGREHSVEELLKSSLVDSSIAVNTMAYYESLAVGKPCLRWTEWENEDFFGMDDKFSSLDEFEQKIETLRTKDQDKLLNEIENVIRYTLNPNLQSKI